MEALRPTDDERERQFFYDLVYGAVTGVLLDRGPLAKEVLGTFDSTMIARHAASDAILDHDRAVTP